jgi:hypothetical protein
LLIRQAFSPLTLKAIFTSRLPWLLWLAALSLFIAVWLFPLSTAATRLTGLLLLAVVWLGLIALAWQNRPFRFGLLGISALCAVFLVLPARHHLDAASLRSAYVAGLRRYNGVTYYWGGESPKGIDCSGLIRRGLVDSFFLRGIHTLDAGLIRYAIWLWWHDCSARDFGEGHGFTTHLSSTPSINALDHSKILPGDLAVTSTGVHNMAYLGDNLWIEADPDIGRVVTVSVPTDNLWFHGPMNIVRWNVLQQ